MIEVLLFSFSISIDAFGYSLGFGSKNIKINKIDFFILNIINSLILTLLLVVFYKYSYILNNEVIEIISPLLLCLFGFYYIVQSFIALFKSYKDLSKKSFATKNQNILLGVQKNTYFKFSDLFLLLSIFIFENAFSTFIFYTNLSNPVLFVASNFFFHYMFFLIGFDLGNKIVKKINFSSSFITGYIFAFLGLFEIFM